MTRNWKQWLRLILAVLFAPILAAGLVAALLAIIMVPDLVFQTEIDSATSRPATAPEIMASLFGFGAIGGAMGIVLGWPAMILGGLPVHAWLVRKGRTDWLPYALIGLGVGTITMLIYFLATGSWRDPMGLLDGGPLLLSGPLTGFLAASLFWLIRLPPRIPAP
ncbi:hypothetical protein [Hyphomonas jannaschiana]|uniref:Uncharacterized protein n=1 Tax=Hyphomonas jannaschiana VP2 TaxID=1280952 RepID=A0A059FKQ1_9PROT|nr:hypothetical protein [Hyphomonas jannaschiana]KCZ91101.1 hypothetical protein HJA_01145 [Hyphomonas jannaschiana VP2]